MTVTDISQRFLARGNVYLPHIAVIEKMIPEPSILTLGMRSYGRSSPLSQGNSLYALFLVSVKPPSLFLLALPDGSI